MRKLFQDLAHLLVCAVQDSIVERHIRRAVLRQQELNDAYDKGFINGCIQGIQHGLKLGAAQCNPIPPQLPDTPRWKPFHDDSELDT